MSVYDEARRKCPKCGKRINHWEENACDNGTCVPSKNIAETRIPDDIECTSSNLNDISNKFNNLIDQILNDAVGEWIKKRDNSLLFEKVEYAKAFKHVEVYLNRIK
jgi:hypothetical protein